VQVRVGPRAPSFCPQASVWNHQKITLLFSSDNKDRQERFRTFASM
jgi:hypothetical protein